MNKTDPFLKTSIFLGGLYFLGVSAAHAVGMKVPYLYIYFNIPSTVYQDRIISLLSFGWAVFFFSACGPADRIKILIRPILCAGAAALLGLAAINFTTNFKALSPTATPSFYWLQLFVLAGYFLWLFIISSLRLENGPGSAGPIRDEEKSSAS